MIIYFSGTGNSMLVAKNLVKETNDIAISFKEAKKTSMNNLEILGFVFPVHNYDVPNLFKKFLKEIELSSVKYSFGIITHGGDKGNSILTLKEILNQKGIRLSYHNDILMPVNSRIMYGMVTDKIEERILAQVKKVENIANEINNAVLNVDGVKKNKMNAFVNRMGEKQWAKNMFTPSVRNEICIGCGICQKVCPVDAITIENKKAFIENTCESCLTCMHWCPELAIHFRKRNVKKKQQYHNPEIKLRDIIEAYK